MRRLICILLLCCNAPLAFAALDLNKATESELDALPGVGPARAQAIVEYRRTHGAFASVEDLRNVKGIGDKTHADLKPLLTVGSAAPVATPVESSAPTPPQQQLPEKTSGGFPWWVLIVGAVVGAVAFVLMRRARAPVRERSEVPAAPASPAAAATPRPAGSTSTGPVAAPARPAGAPPRPAGSAPAEASAEPPPSPPAPKPAGAPPKPAGSH